MTPQRLRDMISTGSPGMIDHSLKLALTSLSLEKPRQGARSPYAIPTREQADRIGNYRPEGCECVICKINTPRRPDRAYVKEVTPCGYATGRYIGLSRDTYEKLKGLAE